MADDPKDPDSQGGEGEGAGGGGGGQEGQGPPKQDPPQGGGGDQGGDDPFAGLGLSSEDQATVRGIISEGPKSVAELLVAKREANAEAKALRVAREKAEALGYDGDDPVASALADLGEQRGAQDQLAEVEAKASAAEFRANVLEKAAAHGQVARPKYLVYEAEQAQREAGDDFDLDAWLEKEAGETLAPAFKAGKQGEGSSDTGRSDGGPPADDPDDIDVQIRKAHEKGDTIGALRLQRKKQGLSD